MLVHRKTADEHEGAQGDEMSEMTREMIEDYRNRIKRQTFPSESQDFQFALCDFALSALTARSDGFREGVEAAAKVLSAPSGEVAEMVKRLRAYANESGGARVEQDLLRAAALLSKVGQGEVDALGEQPTYFEMARTRMLRKRIADIVATHDAFVADHKNKDRAHALKHAIGKARGIGLTKAEQEKQEDYDCPHAYPHRYCETCKVDPCPIGLKRPPPPERP